ncbi:hypothetical protein [Candidatus Scalindua japonica]|uniref:hypothetical protein n=1 Tax=Candidatus Scalindua japonica TaxID=1284222 RepID=UPI0010560B4D|nr:hypothetical protein [Candidatus Scalindua japonica]
MSNSRTVVQQLRHLLSQMVIVTTTKIPKLKIDICIIELLTCSEVIQVNECGNIFLSFERIPVLDPSRKRGVSPYQQVRFFIPLRCIQNDKSACHSEESTATARPGGGEEF